MPLRIRLLMWLGALFDGVDVYFKRCSGRIDGVGWAIREGVAFREGAVPLGREDRR